MKQTKLWLTTIAALLCSLTVNAYDFRVNGISYEIISETTVCVTYNDKYTSSGGSTEYNRVKYEGDVIIPQEVTYGNITYSVTSIGNSAFDDCSSLTAITIPEGVTSIGNYAFYGCSSLTTITIPEGVTSIGTSAFYGCSSLTSVTLPESVSYIGFYAFSGCSSLIAIVVAEGNKVYDSRNGCNAIIETASNILITGCSTTIIPENVTSIEYSAFRDCSSLTSISLPEGVTSIGSYAFYGCSSLTAITIPENVTSIGRYAFSGCGGELTVNCNIPSASSNEYGAFYNSNFTKVTIGEGVTSIGSYAFSDCSSLYSVTIGSGVLSIGSNAFSTPKKVIWLTNTPPTGYANAKGSINYVSNDQYTNLSNTKVYPYLSSMFEVEGVNYVPVSPSERTCHAIDCVYGDAATAINVSETASFKGVAMKVTAVMPYTFYGNDHIKEVSVSHLGNIGDYAFYDCDGIENVVVSNQGGIGYQAFYNCDSIKDVNVSNLGNIGNQAFYNCDAIESVNISNQGNIGEQAFYDCDGIKTIDVRNRGLVGNQAFYGCNGMETAIVANLAPISSSNNDAPITFADWTSTNKLNSSTSSKTYTFTAKDGMVLSFEWWVSSESGYDKLIVTLDGTTILEKSGNLSGTYCNAISQGEHTLVVKYTKDSSNSSGSDQAKVSNILVSAQTGVGGEAFSGCSSLKTVALGDSIGSLGNQAFYQCASLQEIVIPDSVKLVGEDCFRGCSAMESVTIGDGVTTISNYAFTGCSALNNVRLGNSVATISDYAFQNCSSLPEISIPQATTTIGNYVFSGCSKLADVIIEDRTTALNLGSNGSSALFADCPLDSVYIGGKITYNTTSSKGYSPFYRNTSLRTVVIADREEQVYDNEFYGCTNLQNVTIDNGVKAIGNYAFSGCSSLEGFSFGSSMESIGNEAFSDCTNLTSITSHAAVPPTCGTQALDDINKWNCTLRVPIGYAAAYQAAEQWKEFFFIEDVVETSVHMPILNSQPTTVYDLSGRKVEVDDLRELEKGVYVVNGRKVVINNK